MWKLVIGAVIACLIGVSGPVLAQDGNNELEAEKALREVEVSLWEAVASAMYHAAAPQAKGTILGGMTADTGPADEYQQQLSDVTEYLAKWQALVGDAHTDAVTLFADAFAEFLTASDAVMGSESPSPESLAQMWIAAHKADDIIDEKLQD